MERFFNGVPSTITSTILDTDNPAVFTVDNDDLPPDANYLIKIGSEFLRVTSVDVGASPDEYTADRAQEGTTAATHNSGDAVVHLISAGSLSTILTEQNEHVDTLNVVDNRVGRVQNSNKKRLIDTGSGFTNWFCDQIKVTPIVAGDFTLRNDDSVSLTLLNEYYKISRLTPAAVGLTLWSIPRSSLSNNRLVIGFQFGIGAVASETPAIGVGVFDSSNNKHIVALHGCGESSPTIFNKIEKWTNFTTLSSTPLAPIAAYPSSIYFMKVEYDGTNVIFYVSSDGDTYVSIGSTAQSFLTIDELVIAIDRYAVASLFHVGDI